MRIFHVRQVFSFVILFVVSCALGFSLKHVLAGNTHNVFGFGWNGNSVIDGSNTAFGWLSTNSLDCDTNGDGVVNITDTAPLGCPVGVIGDYGVNIPAADGLVTGYAWSEHYGFVSFNAADTVGCPVGSCQARRVGDTLVGWARVLSIRDAAVNSGGWMGFISLDSSTSASAQPYGITLAGNTLAGYAYSDELGWFNMNGIQFVPPSILMVCRGGFIPLAQGGEVANMSLERGTTADMTVYFDDTPDCAGNDVTTTTVFADTVSPVVTLSAPGSRPRLIHGAELGNEDVTLTFAGQTVTFHVSVTQVCSSNCGDDAAQHCLGEAFSATNSCGNPEACTGTRNCDYNIKEVAP